MSGNAAPIEVFDVDCGIAYKRLAAWLADELVLPHEGESWVYRFGERSCNVSLAPLQNRTLGRVELERTHLLAQGDPEAVEAFRKLFTLRFVSAGG